MELVRISLVNWHLFDREDIELAGHIGILGENRSGKSTLLDLMQTVFTGASRTYLRLNAKAGEAGGRGRGGQKRSVHSYCLGMLGEGEARRDEARTYIALGFRDPAGIRSPVTIGLAIEARKTDTNEDVFGRFVYVGALLATADFVAETDRGVFPLPWDQVRDALDQKAKNTPGSSFVNHRDRAIAFVREYLRHLVPSLPGVEQNAIAFQKAVVNAATLGQDITATNFVREFIIEDSPIRVADLRESIATYKSVSQTIDTLLAKLERLKAIHLHVVDFEKSLHAEALEKWIESRGRFLAARAERLANLETIAIAQRHTQAAEEDERDARETLKEADHEIEKLNAAIAAHDAQTGRQQAQEMLKLIDENLATLDKSLARRAREIHAAAEARDALADGMAGALLDLTAALRAQACDPARIAALEEAVKSGAAALDARIRADLAEISAKGAAIAAELKELRPPEEGRLRGPSDHLDQDTRRLVSRLESAGMTPRVLCDVIEVKDEAWIGAAEGLLGRAREAVFVERSHIREATELFRLNRRQFPRAQLVSVNKLERFRDAPASGSFASLFRSEDADAIAFLQSRYANVRLAETLDEFNRPGRALMKDGLYDDGLIRGYRTVDPSSYKLGKAAQAQAQMLREERADNLVESLRALEARRQKLAAVETCIRTLTSDEDTIANMLAKRAELERDRKNQNDRIEAAKIADDGGLRKRRQGQLDLKRAQEAKLAELRKRNALHDARRLTAEKNLKLGEKMPGSNAARAVAHTLWGIARKTCDYRQSAPEYAGRLKRYRAPIAIDADKADEYPEVVPLLVEAEAHRRISARAGERASERRNEMANAERRARHALGNYFSDFGRSASVGAESQLVAEVLPWMEATIADMEQNELRHYQEEARQAADLASRLFRGEFVNQLNQRINKMNRDLQALNASLKDHPFHNERYSFHRSVAAEFKSVVDVTQLSDEDLNLLFKGEIPDDSPHAATLRAVEALLTSPDQPPEAFEDYRQFFVFEIHMEDIVTGRRTRWEVRRGVGSGAEQQVPIYVAIGASLASVYGSSASRARPSRTLFGGASRAEGISIALFDEAFSKMDGKNQRQMMSFYQDLGLQVIVAAPMEKKAAIMGYMETIVEVDRIGERSRTTTVSIKDKARAAVQSIDPDLLDDEDLAMRAGIAPKPDVAAPHRAEIAAADPSLAAE